ncbi:MAG: leucine-rich repeat protein, partial [Lachnospiraceae bacterium]|nr:leucine-rich repeat protein [Lachnospiraceae bacterium]
MAKAKAKKAKEVKEAKKINLKLKKQIRLTLGAILMISAIVVALIPPGNIEAGDKADAVNPTDDTRGVPAYPSSPSFPTSPSFLQKPATIPHTSYTIYPLSGANDSWAYVPQFFYSVTNAIPNTQGNFVIINGYSSLLPADQIKLDNFLAQEYFTVSEEKYNNFFSANQGSDFSTCPGSGHTDPSKCNHWRVSTGPDVQGGPGSTPYTYSYSDWYTRDEGRPGAPLGVSPDMTYIKAQEEWVTAYNAYKDQCAAFYKYVETDIPKYNTDLSTYLNGTAYLDWVSGGSVGAEPVGRPTEPTSVSQPGGSFTGLGAFTITRDSDGYFNLSPAAVGNYHLFVGVPFSRTPADLSPDKKFRFYCQYTEGLMGKSGDPNFIHRLPGLGFSLKLVQDVASSTPLTAAYVYVPRGGTLIDEPGTALDSNGFLVNIRSQMVIGIGDEAFQMVGNVDTLIFPDEIAYIGDRAFEGSFIKSLNLANVTNVGNQAFKGCTQLTSLSMNDGLRIIGGEAFFGSGLLNVTLPYSVREIGLGAFAKSHSLVTVDMSKMDWDPISIKDFAFYDCSVLKEVKFTDKRNSFDIGTAAFALETAGQGAMETITLPKNITGVAGSALGNWLFSGRMGLKSVIMPESYGTDGSKGTIYIPSGMFRMCTGLEFVEFPNVANGRNGGYVSYNPSSDDIAPANYHPTDNSASYVGKYLFLDVTNPNFYVRGPETSQNGRIALPRRSTWSAFTQVSDFVPYRYINSAGVQCYEISDGEYILQANASGQLTGCQLVDDTDWNGTNPINLVIPEFVGDIKISDIASGALSNKNLRSRLRSLTISNNTLTSVAPEAFKGLPRLEEVVIGNTVKEVGKEAFADCPLLTNVTFNSPSGFAHKDFILGEGAFKTNSKKLVLNGDIVPGYAPFEFAMDPVEGNIAFDLNGNPTGLRILYKSLSPSLLTVMYDIDQKEVVLLNYPKFDQIDNNKAYLDSMERYYTRMYGGIDYDQARDDFVLAYQAAANPDTLYDSDLFGPWISRAYLDDPTENGRRTPDPAIVLNPAGGIDGIKSYY